MHLLAAGLLYLSLSSLPEPNQRYGITPVLAVAILLRTIESLISESDSLVTANFGNPEGFALPSDAADRPLGT